MDKSLIQIFRGDDTDGLGYQSIQGKITTTLDLTGCRAVFRYLGFTQEFDPIPENGRITITMPASATSKFPPGLGYASLRVYDSENKVRTFTNRIPVFVTVYAPSECGGEFEVVFNGGNLELEPLKIKSVNGYRIYDGYLEQIIDKATAIEYGLALLFDSGDSQKDGNSGYAATPKAVQAAYDAIIGELTDNYYNAEETEEAIDRIAAYYITADAQGNPFGTYAALMNATVFYSGGQQRTPTRNDYCVVLADETHGGKQYRYIYATNQQGVGQWEAQYAVGGSIELDNTVTRTSTNGVKSSGIWSAIWGELTALPGFSSLYDWCVAQLAGKASTADATLTRIYSDTPTFSKWSFSGNVSSGVVYTVVEQSDGPDWWGYLLYADGVEIDGIGDFDKQQLTVEFGTYSTGITAIRIRTDIIGYTLGSQSDKPLQPKGDYALLSDIYAAVQQIAPAWVSGTSYAETALVSYNGVVYARKTSGSITSSTNPASDTTNWEAKKISELFLPLTGGTMTGELKVKTGEGISFGDDIKTMVLSAYIDGQVSTVGLVLRNDNLSTTVAIPLHRTGTLALSSNTMRFSTDVSYAVGDVVFYNGAFYRCTTAHTFGAWNASHFSEVIGGLSTGTPTAPTPASGDNSTKVATTAFVQNAIGGITPGPDNTKLDSTSAAPAFSTSSTYAAGEHVTYNGKLYKCTTAVTVAGAWDASKWTADTMTDPDAVLDITSQNQLRVVAKDGTLLWAQGYDLASTSSATLACDAVNNFTFADGATTQAFALPSAPTGKVGDFILDIDNSANTGAATMTLTGLDTTFSASVPKGESLTDMLSIAAGELARFYITLTTFRINNLPTWQIVKQVVENGGATV